VNIISSLLLLASRLLGLLGSLSLGARTTDLLLDLLDDTDGNGLSHVTDGEATKWSVLGELLNAHWLAWDKLDDASLLRLDALWGLLEWLTSTTIDLLEKLGELASNVGGVAIQHWGVASADLTRVVQDDDLSGEASALLGWVVLVVRSDVATTQVLDGDVLDVEADVVTWAGLLEGLVVISTDLTSVLKLTGAKLTTMPGLMTPVSTRPTGTVPIPPIL